MSRNFPFAFLLATAVCLSACGGTTSQYADPPADAPDGLYYPGPNTFIQGEAITPLVPTVRGNVSSYFVTPDLPPGLHLGSDGVISGTPTDRKSPETYLVTALNASGSSSFGVTITVLGRYIIGGLVSGLTGAGLVLTNSGVDNLPINTNGPFTFARQVPAGSAYNVVVGSQPAGQTCSVAGGSGALTNASYNGVVVTCSANAGKAARFGDMAIRNSGEVLHLACFYPTSPESVRGYVVDPVTGAITVLDAAAGTPLPIGCGLYAIDVGTNAVWTFRSYAPPHATFMSTEP